MAGRKGYPESFKRKVLADVKKHGAIKASEKHNVSQASVSRWMHERVNKTILMAQIKRDFVDIQKKIEHLGKIA